MATYCSPATMKALVGRKAVEDYVRSGMVVGLGTGSTAMHAIEALGKKLRSGELKDVKGIPSSEASRKLAESFGIPLTSLDQHPIVDVAIDGADEVDHHLNLVKGRGGALLREKLIAEAAKKFIVVVDETKWVGSTRLGSTGGVPIEICSFARQHILLKLKQLSIFKDLGDCDCRLRMDGDNPFVTDNGNVVVDVFTPPGRGIEPSSAVANTIKQVVGVVEHGLFLRMADICLVGKHDGVVEVRTPTSLITL